MKTSESIVEFAKAMLKAQEIITFAAKDALNPFHKSTYANIVSIIDAIKPALNSNGIMFIQSPTTSDVGVLAITTRLMHISGEWIEDTMTMPLKVNDPQGYGSAVTYARRYSLAAITGLYQDDDDANSVSPESIAENPKANSPKQAFNQAQRANDLPPKSDAIKTYKENQPKDYIFCIQNADTVDQIDLLYYEAKDYCKKTNNAILWQNVKIVANDCKNLLQESK